MPASKETLENEIRQAVRGYRTALLKNDAALPEDMGSVAAIDAATAKIVTAKRGLIEAVSNYSQAGYTVKDMPEDLATDKNIRQAMHNIGKSGGGRII